MKDLIVLIESSQAFLVRRTLEYAKLQKYTQYTSTLEEAWQVSINGLSAALLTALGSYEFIPELNVDKDYGSDQIGAFGVLEAQRHRDRGVTLEMFLGLMKYYRQSYLDLVMVNNWDKMVERKYILFINRFFDHIELAFCSEWTGNTKDILLQNLQNTNRIITNEKNKYLTIFESFPIPAIILNSDNIIDNMNKAAIEFFKYSDIVGTSYYSVNRNTNHISQLLPWLTEDFTVFMEGSDIEATVEKDLEISNMEARNMVIKFHRMLDISDKYKGTVILFMDMTFRKQIEERLRFMSFHDNLTQLYNRTFFEEELVRLKSGRFDPIAIIVADVDGLKLVNDTYGHQAGDALLIATAAILRQSFREGDVVARVGGDEFAVVMPSSSPKAIKEACERVQMVLLKHNQEAPMVPLSFSIGAALGGAHNGTIDQIYKNADNEMYRSKAENRETYRLLIASLDAIYGDKLFRL